MHIVFDADDAAALQKSFELDESLAAEIVVVEDDWSIGPLRNHIDGGKEISRDEWLAALGVQRAETNAIEKIRNHLADDPTASVTLWIAPNSRDVCGYYQLVSSLQDFKGRVWNVWLNNLPFINEKMQVFYPVFLKEIPAGEFLKARKLALEITSSTFETDPDEWNRLTEEHSFLRLSDGGKKVSAKPVDYFDKEIITGAPADWQKSARVIHAIKSKSKHHPSKVFLLWRMRELIHDGKLEARGYWPATEQFEIKKPQAGAQTVDTHE